MVEWIWSDKGSEITTCTMRVTSIHSLALGDIVNRNDDKAQLKWIKEILILTGTEDYGKDEIHWVMWDKEVRSGQPSLRTLKEALKGILNVAECKPIFVDQLQPRRDPAKWE